MTGRKRERKKERAKCVGHAYKKTTVGKRSGSNGEVMEDEMRVNSDSTERLRPLIEKNEYMSER